MIKRDECGTFLIHNHVVKLVNYWTNCIFVEGNVQLSELVTTGGAGATTRHVSLCRRKIYTRRGAISSIALYVPCIRNHVLRIVYEFNHRIRRDPLIDVLRRRKSHVFNLLKVLNDGMSFSGTI